MRVQRKEGVEGGRGPARGGGGGPEQVVLATSVASIHALRLVPQTAMRRLKNKQQLQLLLTLKQAVAAVAWKAPVPLSVPALAFRWLSGRAPHLRGGACRPQ
jgi:hypothetical protein